MKWYSNGSREVVSPTRPYISLTGGHQTVETLRCSTVGKALRGSRTGGEERSRARVRRDKERVFKAVAESVDGLWVAFALMGLNILLNASNSSTLVTSKE